MFFLSLLLDVVGIFKVFRIKDSWELDVSYQNILMPIISKFWDGFHAVFYSLDDKLFSRFGNWAIN